MATSFPMSLPHAPTGFVNQAALDTAFTTPINDLAAQVSGGYLGDANSGSSIALSTTSDFAGNGSQTFTLSTTRRVLILTIARYQITSTAGRMTVQSGYNTGTSPSIGSVVKVGQGSFVTCTVAGINGTQSVPAFGTALLAAGTYTAYPVVTRVNGSTTDLANTFGTLVLDMGSV